MEKKGASSRRSQAADDAARLRMPPIIEHRPNSLWQRLRGLVGVAWAGLVEAMPSSSPVLGSGLRRFAAHLAYQAGLAALLLGALGLTGLAILQAPSLSLPDWQVPQLVRNFADDWGAEDPLLDKPVTANSASETMASESPASQNSQGDNMSAAAPISADTADRTPPLYTRLFNNDAEDNDADTNDALAAAAPMPRQTNKGAIEGAINQPVNPPDDQLSQIEAEHWAAQYRAEQAAHARTKAALAIARRANAKSDAAPNSPLMRRAIMAEWLVRLQNGLPFDDLLTPDPTGSQAGQAVPVPSATGAGAQRPTAQAAPQDRLDAILTRRELSAFGLFAQTGVPTKPSLLAQLNRLSELQSGRQAEPSQTRPAQPSGWLGWLAANSNGMVRVAAAPPLADAGALAALGRIITAGDYPRATIELRRVVLRWELQNQADAAPDIYAALHTLYADVQALAELTPLMRDVRADFIAGVRP